MRVVVDTNVIVSGVFWGGTPKAVLELWGNGRFDLLMSRSILSEYARALKAATKKSTDIDIDMWVSLFARDAVWIHVSSRRTLCRDADDNKFIECALDGQARCIVSGDRDLLDLGTVEGVPIVTPRMFVDAMAD